ncbi:hypothetical protein [Candidatus Sodalis sp. SoCistrobi]|uniref:hypothetical protein n=1 Tax=Candidatus Sodalis sp. SoCistrobi TaxID=1922216 RepID=UPI00093D5D47|nr:hypothetical protein [Candidatus Sodalis sp. SoCistrobi]
MRLRRDIERLRARCEQRRQTFAATLAALARQRETLIARLRTLAEQQQALVRQMALTWPQGVVDHRALMLHQRRLMVRREENRQLADRQRQLEQDVMALDKQQRDALCQQRAWQRKREKYDGWLERHRQAHRLTQLYRQETETEEMMTWNRSRG